MNLFTQGIVTTTSTNDCPRPWFMQNSLQGNRASPAESYHGDPSMLLQQQQVIPPNTQASQISRQSSMENQISNQEQQRMLSSNTPVARPLSHHLSDQGRIPSPNHIGLPRMMSHQSSVMPHSYIDQSIMAASHSLVEPQRVPSRSQLDQRIPSPAQQGLQHMSSHIVNEPPRVPSRSNLEQVKIPSPAEHDIVERSLHRHHQNEVADSLEQLNQRNSSPHDLMSQANPEPTRMASHSHSQREQQQRFSSHTQQDLTRMTHTPQDQSRMTHTPHDQSRMTHTSHDQSRMTHTPHDQSRMTHTSQDQSRMTHTPHDQSRMTHTPHDQSRMTHTPHDQSRMTHTPNDQSRMTHTPHDQSRMTHTPNDQSRMTHTPYDHMTHMPLDQSLIPTQLHQEQPHLANLPKRDSPHLTNHPQQQESSQLSRPQHESSQPTSRSQQSALTNHSQQSPLASHSQLSSVLSHSQQSPMPSHTQQSTMPSHSQQSTMSSHSQQSSILSHSQRSTMSSHSQQSTILSHSQRSIMSSHSQQSTMSSHSQQSTMSSHSQQSTVPPVTQREQTHNQHRSRHSSHQQLEESQITSREEPRAPSRSEPMNVADSSQNNQSSGLDNMPSQSDQPAYGFQDTSEAFRQMAKQHGLIPSSQSDYLPLTMPLPSISQGLVNHINKQNLGRPPYLTNPAFKQMESGMLKCNFCSEIFTTTLQLQTHMIAHYEMAIRSLPGNPFSDSRPLSDNVFVKTEKGSKPMTSTPLKPTNVSLSGLDASPMETDSSLFTPSKKTPRPMGEKKHECATCLKKFTRTDHLKRHALKAHPEIMQAVQVQNLSNSEQLGIIRNDPPQINMKKNEGQHQCFVCGKRFKRSDHLRRHMLKMHSDILSSEATNQSLFMRFDIRAMYAEANATKSPKTPKTPFVPEYTEAEKLEKRHVCVTCEKRFKRQDHLKRHATIHSDEKPYNCVLCGKGFRREHHVQRHERTHTGEKPYECSTCGKRFARIDHMKKHNKSHLFDAFRKSGQKLSQSLPLLPNLSTTEPMCPAISTTINVPSSSDVPTSINVPNINVPNINVPTSTNVPTSMEVSSASSSINIPTTTTCI